MGKGFCLCDEANGIMQGVGANRFDPKNGYTCEQSIITMLRMTQKA